MVSSLHEGNGTDRVIPIHDYEFCIKKSRWTGICTCVGGQVQVVPEREAADGVWLLNWEYVSVIYLEDEVNSTLIKFADYTKLESVANTIEERYKTKWPRKV